VGGSRLLHCKEEGNEIKQHQQFQFQTASTSQFKHRRFTLCLSYWSEVRDGSVGIATGYGLDDRGVAVRVPVDKNFHFSVSSRPVLGPTQSPIQWVPGALSLGVKWTGREADHSPPTSAEVLTHPSQYVKLPSNQTTT
jgi:hypothetical protein